MKSGKEAINIVWQTLFPVKGFSEGEYVEIVYDNGDKNFRFACHVRSLGELLRFAEENNGKVNVAICPNTRKPQAVDNRFTIPLIPEGEGKYAYCFRVL